MYVFIGNPGGDSEIRIESECYQTRSFTVGETQKKEIQRVWMMPSRGNERIGQMSLLSGQAEPFSCVRIIPEQSICPFRLLRAAAGGDEEIFIFHPPYEYLDGREFRLDNGTDREDIRLLQELETKNQFLLERPIKASYQENSRIYQSISVWADGSGTFFAALKDIPPNGCGCAIEIGNKKWHTNLAYRKMVIERCE